MRVISVDGDQALIARKGIRLGRVPVSEHTVLLILAVARRLVWGDRATRDGSALSQSFPADEHTRKLLPEAATNVWTLTLDPERAELTYYLERHGKPRFEAALVRSVPAVPD